MSDTSGGHRAYEEFGDDYLDNSESTDVEYGDTATEEETTDVEEPTSAISQRGRSKQFAESLLPVLDNFKRVNTQIKAETEGEEKINIYQSISKQFTEVIGSLGVVPVETTGNPFNPTVS
ncbi:hypothetical protein POM88_021160 [Heracleum sosnowskyi]|uniref:Uncharacterized protein n=1 Tax=Heracleum sosnowskyi TaxID=360622 RepID=A0AAD8IGD2_9APIA|nr:hypothetical protein POM88_021160 [Heracleum sosnowskyi]